MALMHGESSSESSSAKSDEDFNTKQMPNQMEADESDEADDMEFDDEDESAELDDSVFVVINTGNLNRKQPY